MSIYVNGSVITFLFLITTSSLFFFNGYYQMKKYRNPKETENYEEDGTAETEDNHSKLFMENTNPI